MEKAKLYIDYYMSGHLSVNWSEPALNVSSIRPSWESSVQQVGKEHRSQNVIFPVLNLRAVMLRLTA